MTICSLPLLACGVYQSMSVKGQCLRPQIPPAFQLCEVLHTGQEAPARGLALAGLRSLSEHVSQRAMFATSNTARLSALCEVLHTGQDGADKRPNLLEADLILHLKLAYELLS